MALLRNLSREKFTVIDNIAVRDDDLSLKALGLLVKLLSLPDNWEFSENGLIAIFKKDGQASIRSGLKELEEFGYLTRTKMRDSKGRVNGVEWIITENPRLDKPNLENPRVEYPSLENPSLENPSMENPNLENQPQYNTNTIKNDNKEIHNNKILSEPLASAPKKPKETRHKYGEYNNVLLSDDDLAKLQEEFPTDYTSRIENLSSYMASTGKTYKNHLATIRNWARKDAERRCAVKAPTKEQKPTFAFLEA